jgi:hypothetical protein
MLNVPSRRLYFIYTISLIAALGMAAFAAEEEEREHKFTAKMTGRDVVFLTGYACARSY